MPPFKKLFTHKLTDADLAEKAKLVAAIHENVESIEEDRAGHVEVAKSLKERIEVLETDARAVSKAVRDGVEPREVDCEWRPHASRPVMQLHRLDLAEIDPERIVEEREMTDRERQGDFGLAVEPPPAAEENEAPVGAVLTTGLPAPGQSTVIEGELVEEERPEPPRCPALVPGNTDGICGAAGSKRAGGFCPDHRDLSGAERVKAKAAKKAREAAADARAAEGYEGATAAGVDAMRALHVGKEQ
jgi:hypothetical protein